MVLDSPDIDRVLKNYLKSDDFEFISCQSSDLEEVSVGLLSEQDKACIRYKTGGEEKKLHVFIKRLPQNPYHQKKIISTGCFHREVVLYNELLNHFHDQLQDNSIPECYLARSNEIMVMEDLAKKGFKNKGLYETFDLPHCEKTLETLAKLHSLSFITEKNEGCKMTEIVPVIKTEVMVTKDESHVARKAYLNALRVMKTIVQIYLPNYDQEVTMKAFHYMKNLHEVMKSSKLYANVLAHSDLWGGNVMFRYNECGMVKEACIFDFQLATYKAPTYDIQLFLHCCTEKQFRDKYNNHLMKYYYTVLSSLLSSANINVEDLITWSDFEGMLEETLPISLAQAYYFLLSVLMPGDLMKDIKACPKKYRVYYEEERTEVVLEAMKRSEYKTRVLAALTNYLDYFRTKQ